METLSSTWLPMSCNKQINFIKYHNRLPVMERGPLRPHFVRQLVLVDSKLTRYIRLHHCESVPEKYYLTRNRCDHLNVESVITISFVQLFHGY